MRLNHIFTKKSVKFEFCSCNNCCSFFVRRFYEPNFDTCQSCSWQKHHVDRSQLDCKTLKNISTYNKHTGLFVSLINSIRGDRKVGDKMGYTDNRGYISFRIGGVTHKAHRLAWLYEYGSWPKNQIDHINGDKSDNRIINLRDVTNSENCQNRRNKNITSISGYTGVTKSHLSNNWTANIGVNGARKYLGTFETPEAASEAYLDAKKELHIQ